MEKLQQRIISMKYNTIYHSKTLIQNRKIFCKITCCASAGFVVFYSSSLCAADRAKAAAAITTMCQ